MTPEEFETIIDETMARMPQWVIDAMDNVAIMVTETPDPEITDGADDLLGFYVGVPLHERGIDYAGELPDVIYVYRQPHLALGLPPAELRDEIVTTLVHELAHHFGIDDDKLHELGWG